MKHVGNPLYGANVQKLLEILEVDETQLKQVTEASYRKFTILDSKGKKRQITEPNKELMPLLRKVCECLQETECPEYNKCGYKEQSAFKNAMAHLNANAVVTTDISDYYDSTKTEYVKRLFEEEFNIKGEALEILLRMTTYEGHIPTGAPTSTILAFLTHRELFDQIAEEMKRRKIMFTLFADDMTMSAKHGITRIEVRYIQSVLSKHNLKIKNKKTKFYSYRKALVTGYYLHQSGRISVPDWIGHKIILKLKETPISKMDEYDLKKLLGYINYQRQCDKEAFKVTRIRAIKRLKQLQKERVA